MNSHTGRIAEIIEKLKSDYGVSDLSRLTDEQKLHGLCDPLLFSFSDLDNLISNNSAVLRTVKGHAFESFFDHLMKLSGYEVEVVGGDTQVDRIVNGHTLQLKTKTEQGSNAVEVAFKTHKTHGAKSELESMSYYDSIDEFPEFLVGLVSYNPLYILFLHQSEIPRHHKDQNRIKSPFKVRWKNHSALNAYSRIGAENINYSIVQGLFPKDSHELLPRTSQIIGITSHIIIDTILMESNFRIWDMNIRGFAREFAFISELVRRNIHPINLRKYRRVRADKSDIMLKEKFSLKDIFFQIKGVTYNRCSFVPGNSTVFVETQLTRGKVGGLGNQCRLYYFTDFDYLIVVIDPLVVQLFHIAENIGPYKPQWEYYCVPASILLPHRLQPDRIKPTQVIPYTDLQQYRINDAWFDLWEKGILQQRSLF